MKNINIKSKVVAGFLASAVALVPYSAFAFGNQMGIPRTQGGFPNMFQNPLNQNTFNNRTNQTNTQSTQTNNLFGKITFSYHNHQDNSVLTFNKTKLSTILNNLVTAGTITSDEETTIEKVISTAQGDVKVSLDILVATGTITSDQKIAIETAFSEHNDISAIGQLSTTSSQVTFNNGFFSNVLGQENSFNPSIPVTTQSQVTFDNNRFFSNVPGQQDYFNQNIPATTSSQVPLNNEFFPSGANNQLDQSVLTGTLDSLVTAGTITSNQETIIETSISNANGNITSALDSLVTAGTITYDQETSITATLLKLTNI